MPTGRASCAWLGQIPAPQRIFVTHGEPAAADALRLRLHERLGWQARCRSHGERVRLW